MQNIGPRGARAAALLAAALLLAGCSALHAPGDGAIAPPAPQSPPVTAPRPTGAPTAPAATAPTPPPSSTNAANAVPRIERIARGAPNAPYRVAGQSYLPENSDVPLAHRGVASWYGKPFHGRPTASGEIYDMHAMTAAHKTMPLPSYARVRNPANDREVIVRVNDRGPFKTGRVIDLSFAAARRLGISGVAPVVVTRLTHEEIRSGAWQRPPAVAAAGLGDDLTGAD